MNKTEILNSYKWRHACKEFDATKKISNEDLDFLFDVISLSPSSFGLQPFEVLVVDNKSLLTELLPHVWGGQKQLPTASQTFIFLTKNDVLITDDYFNHILKDVQKVPQAMLEFRRDLINNHQIKEINIEENHRYLIDWAAKQVYIALGNVMTAAAQIGIDSCPIEGFLKNETTEILVKYGVLDLKKHSLAVMCSFGYRKNNPVLSKTRKSLTELIHRIS